MTIEEFIDKYNVKVKVYDWDKKVGTYSQLNEAEEKEFRSFVDKHAADIIKHIESKHGETLMDTDEYWVDRNWNMWSKERYSESEAMKASQSLRLCYNCINCESCEECYSCIDCTNCKFCTQCENCRDCINCKMCQNSADCLSCYHCISCDNMEQEEMKENYSNGEKREESKLPPLLDEMINK